MCTAFCHALGLGAAGRAGSWCSQTGEGFRQLQHPCSTSSGTSYWGIWVEMSPWPSEMCSDKSCFLEERGEGSFSGGMHHWLRQQLGAAMPVAALSICSWGCWCKGPWGFPGEKETLFFESKMRFRHLACQVALRVAGKSKVRGTVLSPGLSAALLSEQGTAGCGTHIASSPL